MAIKENLNYIYNNRVQFQNQQFMDLPDNQAYESNRHYTNLPIGEIYKAHKLENNNDYETFKRFLQFKQYLDVTDRLVEDGVITVNINNQTNEEKDESMPNPFWVVFSIIILAILL